jgi:tetratricopeptide (TPR) repeat protein
MSIPSISRSSSRSSSHRSLLSTRALLTVALVFGALAPLGAVASRDAMADEDPRVTARNHYQAGQKAYAAGDYRLAIREFASAEQLVPSGFNDYNLGLCYDKLGEADPAVRYYRSYLDRVKDAKNRAAVEASVARLELAMSSAQTKEQQRLEAERRAEQVRQAEAARAEQERMAAEAAAKAKADAETKAAAEAEAKRQAEAGKDEVGDAGGVAGGAGEVGAAGGAAGTTGAAAPTGNPQLDRVNGIDLAAIRAQRAPLLGNGVGASAQGGKGAQAANDPADSRGAVRSSSASETPIYKKWWFWTIVGVGALVVINAATEEDSSPRSGRGLVLDQVGTSNTSSGGATLLRW